MKVEKYENTVSVEEYMEKCVDVPTFLGYCKECRNYENLWSCPPYDFDPEDYWRRYTTFHIVGLKIFLPEELTAKIWPKEEIGDVMEDILVPQKRKLEEILGRMEEENPGSISLSGGSCIWCPKGTCTRPEHGCCRHPEHLRYSIESLGGNVGLTVTKYLHQELLWMEEGKLPAYFMLIGGLLLKENG